jgi:hypothetical protein
MVPATPPAKMEPRINLVFSVLGLKVQNIDLSESFREKFRAYVGKYLRTLARFPFFFFLKKKINFNFYFQEQIEIFLLYKFNLI